MTSADRVAEMQRGIVAMCEALHLDVPAGGFSPSFRDGLVPAVVIAVKGPLIAERPLMKAVQRPGNKIIVIGETGIDGNDTAFRSGFADTMIPARALFAEELSSMKGAVAAVRTGLVRSMADSGAAGIAAMICEGVRKGGLGAIIDLALVPLMMNAGGNTPQATLLNETQARYRIEVEPKDEAEVLAAITDTGAKANVVGEITDGKATVFRHRNDEIAVIPNEPTEADMEEVARANAKTAKTA
jgi:phosphoribosylformylglycinamidine synthase